jgi:HK97 family phage portal protein
MSESLLERTAGAVGRAFKAYQIGRGSIPQPFGGPGGAVPMVFWGSTATPIDAGIRVGSTAGIIDYTKSSLIMAVVNWVGTVLAQAPMQVAQREGEKVWMPLPEHPLPNLIEHPNGHFTGEDYWKAFAYYWLTNGNVYLYKARNGAGQVVELWLLDSEFVYPYWSAGNFIDGYRYSPFTGAGMSGRDIPVEDMVHFRFLIDPYNHRMGMAPTRALFDELLTDEAASQYSMHAMQNLGVPPFVISPKPRQDGYYNFDEQQIKDEMMFRLTGAERGKPLVFKQPVDVAHFGFSANDMALDKIRQNPESRVAAVLGVPSIVLGFESGMQRSIYNNMKAAQEHAWQNFVIPTQKLLSAVLREHLLPEFEPNWEQFRIQFDLSNIAALQQDKNELFAREISAWVNGIKKRNEVRSAIGLETDDSEAVYFVEPGVKVAGEPSPMADAGRATLRPPVLQPGKPEKTLELVVNNSG